MSHLTRTHTHTQSEAGNERRQGEKRTDAGYEVMEDFLWEEGLVQSSEVELQDASNGVHVVVVLVSCQRILTYRQMEDHIRWGR